MSASHNTFHHMFTPEVEQSQAEIVKLLLDAGADVNTADDSGMTPLMRAAGWGQYVVMERLLAAKADIHAVDRAGRTALTWTARDPSKQSTERLIALGAKVSAMDALLMGDVRKANSLLDAGEKPTARGSYGETALMVAAERADEKMVERLIGLGLDVNARDDDGATALLFAIAGRPQQVIDSGEILWPPARAGTRIRMIRMLLARGANVNAARGSRGETDWEKGATPLIRAVESGDAEIVRALLVAKPDREAKKTTGKTALQIALEKDRKEIARL